MVCDHCGAAARPGATVCESCGAMLPVHEMGKGAAGIRQGRGSAPERRTSGSKVPVEEKNYLPVLDDRDRPARDEDGADAHAGASRRAARVKVYKPHRVMVNWAMVCAVLAGMMILLGVGAFVFLNMTAPGQLIMARLGYDADAEALWKLGGEYLDQGYIEKSIETYEKAYAQQPEIDGLYDHLRDLCEAYEAAARPADAERIYTLMYTTLDKTNSTAYLNIMRLMIDQGRTTEVAEFLKLAYENTKDVTFKIRRDEMVPEMPTTSLEAGRHLLQKYVELSSPQDYDVYYIIGEEGVLPEDGTLYHDPILLEEGGWTVRAVAVSSELVSDELSVRYIITLPVPDAPKANLAAGPYEKRQRVRLRNVGDDPDVTFYYTIDSSTPTVNSPIYTDEGILLPGGRHVILRAVAVNKYGKVSNEMSVEYQINVPFKNYYRDTDAFGNFAIMQTTLEQFVSRYGEPDARQEITDTAVRGKCVSLTYSWGVAKFYYVETGALLYYIDTTNTSTVGPRDTKFGMTETQITEKFRDMGQLKNQDGSRNLYYDSGNGFYAKVYVTGDTSRRIDYSYIDSVNSATVTLSYYLENNKCVRMTDSYVIN